MRSSCIPCATSDARIDHRGGAADRVVHGGHQVRVSRGRLALGLPMRLATISMLLTIAA
jgi:hypothetical protein